MATGKTNAKHIRVLIEDSGTTIRDISASVANVDGSGLTYAESDVTGYSDGWTNVTLGHPDSTLTVTGPFDNTANTGAYNVFAGANAILGVQSQTFTVEIAIGIRAAATTGDPAWIGEYYCSEFTVGGDGTYRAVLRPGGATAATWTTAT